MTAMNREDIARDFYIEDHALLYGLLGKYAEETCGEAGLEALEKATVLYGRERGLRMAMRAQRNGDELSPRNYLIYGEWSDDRGLCSSRLVSVTPQYKTESTACEWCHTWEKYGLMRYGRVYCTYIDRNLVKGFNPENELGIDGSLSKGDPCCGFHWIGVDYKDEAELKADMKKKAELSDSNIKDFLYHTAHVYSALRRTFLVELGLSDAASICGAAMREYAERLGSHKAAAILAEADQDFLSI